MREAATKFTCDAPGCTAIVHAPAFPADWKVFMEKDYCPGHELHAEVDGVDLPPAGE